jgi:putative transposase
LDRRSDLLVAQIDALRAAVRTVRARSPFDIDAWVVLPDHMHCMWTLPEGDDDFSARWRAIKVAFSKSLPAIEPRSPVGLRRGERGVWQRRYWEHTIRDDRDYAVHVDYIHFNPVKHGLAWAPAGWQFSSFRRCVARGLYPPDWLGGGALQHPPGGQQQDHQGADRQQDAAGDRRDIGLLVRRRKPFGVRRPRSVVFAAVHADALAIACP